MRRMPALLLSLVASLVSGRAALAAEEHPSCAKAQPADGKKALSASDFRKVVDFVAQQVRASKTTVSRQGVLVAIERDLGIDVPAAEHARIKAAVVTRLRESPADLAKLGTARCDQYGACSLESDL